MIKTPFRIIVQITKSSTISRLEYVELSKIKNSPIEQLSYSTFACYLSKDQYNKQMMNPDAKWKCPVTGQIGEWDDDYYEKYFE